MKPLAQYRAAIELERLLGDPNCPQNLTSYRNAMQWDEDDAFPKEAISHLHALNVHHIYVPKSLGGAFESSETFLSLGRTLARRNMSVAVAYSTMLWTMLAWIGGCSEQKARIAERVLHQGHFPCLAYSEEAHGADLLANELRADWDAQRECYRLTGEKWPINRATNSEFLVLLARTDGAAHMRNHSLFIFDKDRLDAERYYHLPRARTHGLRGCDISGVGFHDCALPSDALIGQAGHGLELALKGFQVTRTFCTALSLGVGDSALRIVNDFAQGRRLYGNTVSALPHTRDVLAQAYLSQLIAECISLTAARGLHLFPAQFSTWSSVAKVQVAHLIDHSMHQLAPVLGARYYLRERHAEGMFQKFLRDGAIVSVFDGSSIVCLDALATFLPELANGTLKEVDEHDVRRLFDLSEQLPGLAFDRLSLHSRGRDAVVQSLPQLISALSKLQPDAYLKEETLHRLRAEAARLDVAFDALRADIAQAICTRGQRNSAYQFGLAQRYCALHGAVACLGIWLNNRGAFEGFFANGLWLVAALQRQGEATWSSGVLSASTGDALYQQMLKQTEQSQMYSLLPWPIAQPGQLESDIRHPLFERSFENESLII